MCVLYSTSMIVLILLVGFFLNTLFSKYINIFDRAAFLPCSEDKLLHWIRYCLSLTDCDVKFFVEVFRVIKSFWIFCKASAFYNVRDRLHKVQFYTSRVLYFGIGLSANGNFDFSTYFSFMPFYLWKPIWSPALSAMA